MTFSRNKGKTSNTFDNPRLWVFFFFFLAKTKYFWIVFEGLKMSKFKKLSRFGNLWRILILRPVFKIFVVEEKKVFFKQQRKTLSTKRLKVTENSGGHLGSCFCPDRTEETFYFLLFFGSKCLFLTPLWLNKLFRERILSGR